MEGLSVPFNLSFEYDTTVLFSNSVTAIPALISDTLQYSIVETVTFSSLQPFTIYYFRLKGIAAGNTYYGNTLSFYTAETHLIHSKLLRP